MATFYLDFVNGNDASAGTSWATAWKTLNNGATAARIAPGDEIRIAKSGNPVSLGNATWTSKSTTVTLASAQTTNIYLDGTWTAANSATAGTTSIRKEGANCIEIITPASTTTTTKYAYYATGTVDLSSYDAITFWFRNNAAIADANRYVIKLCSDTTGDTAVDEFAIPAIPSTNSWVPLTLTRNGGGNLGNAIASVALYTGSSSPGNSRTILIDDILGCSSTGFNLLSLISKNSAAYGGTDTWHGLQSINGTTVILGNQNSISAGNADLRGYFTTGATPETVTTYYRPTIKFPMQSAGSASQPIQDSGTSTSLITFSGGWNTSSTTQDGETWIDSQNGQGYGLDPNGNQYIKFDRINLCRFDRGFRTSSNLTGMVINGQAINCSVGLDAGISNSIFTVTTNNNQIGCANQPTSGSHNNVYNIKILNNNSANTLPGGTCTNLIHNNNRGRLLLIESNIINYLELIDNANLDSQNLYFNSSNGSNKFYLINGEAVVKNNTSSNTFYGSGNVRINKLTASGNTNIGSLSGNLLVNQTNAASTQLLGNDSSPITQRNWAYPVMSFNAVNNTMTDNRSYWQYGNALSQTTTRHTATGVAWQINITNTLQTTDRPIYFPIAKVACNASSLVTVKAWVKLSHATDIGAKLMIQANEIAGVTSDVTATKAADTNWEELTITFTPTVAGVAQIYVQGYWLANVADESIFVDDVTISQA